MVNKGEVRKLPRGIRLVIASHNAGKVREIGALLAPYGVEAVSAAALGLPEPEPRCLPSASLPWTGTSVAGCSRRGAAP